MVICALQTPPGEYWSRLQSEIHLQLPEILRPNVQFVRVEKPELAKGCQVFVVVGSINGKNAMAMAPEIEKLSGVTNLVVDDDASGGPRQLENVARKAAQMIGNLSKLKTH